MIIERIDNCLMGTIGKGSSGRHQKMGYKRWEQSVPNTNSCQSIYFFLPFSPPPYPFPFRLSLIIPITHTASYLVQINEVFFLHVFCCHQINQSVTKTNKKTPYDKIDHQVILLSSDDDIPRLC